MQTDSREKLMTRYLLGDLSETERMAVEDEYLADGEKFEQMWALENRLVDDYVRGRLARADRASFERHYLAAPQHRERVAFARTLLKAADAATVVETEPWWAHIAAFLRAPLAGGALAAAMLLLLAGGWWLFNERARRREQLAQAPSARPIPIPTVAAVRAPSAEPVKPSVEPRRDQPAPVFSFLLSSSLVRGGGAPQRLRLPKGTSRVLLRMKLESTDYRTYQANVKTVEGRAVWSRRSLKAPAKGGAPLTVAVPAAKLPADDYVLTLFGLAADGAAQEVERYFFRVSRK